MKLFGTEIQKGWKMQPFELKDAVSGNIISSKDCMGKNGLVVAFICNHCPYVKSIIERFSLDMKILKDDYGINCVAIMPNDVVTYPSDSFEDMQIFAASNEFSFPYLYDETQDVAKAYDAVCTPDIFGFNSDGALVYKGRFDSSEDAFNPDAKEGESELFLAMKQFVETGSTPDEQYPSVGCSIKWKK